MPPLALNPILFCRAALAVGGALAGPVDEPVVPSGATLVVLAATEADTTVTLSARVDGAADATALLWAARDIDGTSIAPVEPEYVERLEGFTRPRLEQLDCDDLADVTYLRTIEGCRVTELPDGTDLPPPDPVFAVDEVPLSATWSSVGVDAEVLAADAVADWLAANELALSADMDAALQGWLDAGADVLAVRPVAPVTPGTWLPPIRVRIDGPPQALPLVGATDASDAHDLWVLALSSDEQGSLDITNFDAAPVDPACMVAPGTSLEERYDEAVATLSEGALPRVLRSYAGPADRCDPCTGDPLLDIELFDLGLDAEAADTWVTRRRMRWRPGQLDQDPSPSLDGRSDPEQLAWVQHEEGLEFALPRCDVGIPDDPGVCPGVRPDARGCTLGPRAPVGLLTLGLSLLVFRRRRGAIALVPLALLALPSPSRAADPFDRAPRTELHVALPVWSTERIVLEGADKGAPFWGNPLLGVEVRQVLVPWKDGANVGVIADVRGFRGRARVPESPLRFTVVEPALGVDARHGHLREGRLLSPKLRYGAQLVLGVQDSSAWRPRATLSFKALVGAGAWIGSGPRQWSVEARASLVPRTDGFRTTFLPEAGLPSWDYAVGSAVVQLMVGVALF